MPADKIDLPAEIDLEGEVSPTRSAMAAPPSYANACRVVHDQNGFTFYFFSAPADLPELPESKQEIERQAQAYKAEGRSGRLHIKLGVELEPVAKVVLPATIMKSFVQLVAVNYSRWLSTFGESDDAKDDHDRPS